MLLHLTESNSCDADIDRNVLVKEDALEHRIFRYLRARGLTGTESLQLEVEDGTVRVGGRLHGRSERRLCLECCRHVPGVLNVIDEVELESTQQASSESCSDYRRES